MDKLTATPLAALASSGHKRPCPAGQIIIYQGDRPVDVFVLASGEVKVTAIDDDGNEKIVHILRAPAVFPLLYYLGQQPDVPFFYTALTHCEVYTVHYSTYGEALKSDSDVALFTLKRAYLEIHELSTRIASLGKTDTKLKLASALRFLAKYHVKARAGDWHRVVFPINHQFLADMIGVTRETTTLTLHQLEDEKIVRFPQRRIMEINVKKLAQF